MSLCLPTLSASLKTGVWYARYTLKRVLATLLARPFTMRGLTFCRENLAARRTLVTSCEPRRARNATPRRKDETGLREEKKKKEERAACCSRSRFSTEAAYIISENRVRCFPFLSASSSRIRYPAMPAMLRERRCSSGLEQEHKWEEKDEQRGRDEWKQEERETKREQTTWNP